MHPRGLQSFTRRASEFSRFSSARHTQQTAAHSACSSYARNETGSRVAFIVMCAPMIVNHARDFQHLVLIEGGYEYWSVPNARKFAANGGKRVLFACGTRWCADKAQIPAAWLRRYHVDVRIEYAPGAG